MIFLILGDKLNIKENSLRLKSYFSFIYKRKEKDLEQREEIDGYYFHKAISRTHSASGEHSHPSCEIYYMKEGQCRYFIDGVSYEVSSGDVIFVGGGAQHRTSYGDAPHSRILINFSEDFIPDYLLGELESLGALYHLKELSPFIEEIFSKIESEYSTHDGLSPIALKTHTAEILVLLLRQRGFTNTSASKSAVIEKVVKYIEENYSGDIRLDGVSSEVSLSPEHLSRIFKKNTGYLFSDYIAKTRLERAEYMLKNEPGKSISEIAFECGFNDGNYFSYKFKERYGVSPSKFRKK